MPLYGRRIEKELYEEGKLESWYRHQAESGDEDAKWYLGKLYSPDFIRKSVPNNLGHNLSAHERFEALASHWILNGRRTEDLLKGSPLSSFYCWTTSAGGKADGICKIVHEFLAASLAEQPQDWWDDRMWERDYCDSCGVGWKFENIMICTDCQRTCGLCCTQGKTRHKNGNLACSCGGELVG